MTIREARPSDVPELTVLTRELGYDATDDVIAARLRVLLDSSDDHVFVAVDENDRAIAWVHAALRRGLELDRYGQIAGLVVSSEHRSKGIGAELVARAEAWMRDHGIGTVRVHSNVIRERAHQFYLRAGYRHAKTSCVFLKDL